MLTRKLVTSLSNLRLSKNLIAALPVRSLSKGAPMKSTSSDFLVKSPQEKSLESQINELELKIKQKDQVIEQKRKLHSEELQKAALSSARDLEMNLMEREHLKELLTNYSEKIRKFSYPREKYISQLSSITNFCRKIYEVLLSGKNEFSFRHDDSNETEFPWSKDFCQYLSQVYSIKSERYSCYHRGFMSESGMVESGIIFRLYDFLPEDGDVEKKIEIERLNLEESQPNIQWKFLLPQLHKEIIGAYKTAHQKIEADFQALKNEILNPIVAKDGEKDIHILNKKYDACGKATMRLNEFMKQENITLERRGDITLLLGLCEKKSAKRRMSSKM